MKPHSLLLALLFFPGFAIAAPAVFGLDPLCDVSVDFRKELDRSRPLHLKFSQYREITGRQTKWFSTVQNDMVSTCLEDKKFADEIVKRDRSALTGQCKPAAEAALVDRELLDFAEKRLAHLKQKKHELLNAGSSGQESLVKVFERNYFQVDNFALGLGESPRETACELRWIYPRELLAKKIPFLGCPDAPPGIKVSDFDKNDPGVFGRLLTRYARSAEYNTERRNNAAATAKASQARYEECIAKFPGSENVLVKATTAKGPKAVVVPAGKEKTRQSTITGVEEDKKKSEQK